MSLKHVPIALLDQLIDTVRKIGVPRTETLLSQATRYQDPNDFLKIMIIQNSVCNVYQISDSALKSMKKVEAMRIFIYMLNKHLEFSQKNIRNIINISRDTYYKSLKYIKELDPKIKFDADTLIKINQIEEMIINQFKNI